MAAKLRCLFAALFCLVPALACAQPGPSPGNITTPLATDFVPLYGRGTTANARLIVQLNQMQQAQQRMQADLAREKARADAAEAKLLPVPAQPKE